MRSNERPSGPRTDTGECRKIHTRGGAPYPPAGRRFPCGEVSGVFLNLRTLRGSRHVAGVRGRVMPTGAVGRRRTGNVVLALKLGHAPRATAVLLRRDERAQRTLHRISVGVWSAWLVPLVSGMPLA